VTARQSQDTFATFAAAGKQLSHQGLQQAGEAGERHHEEYVREANRLIQALFVEHAGGAAAGASKGASAHGTP